MPATDDRPLVSICVPAYEMHGRGTQFLDELLGTVEAQTLHRLEVVVADDSRDADVRNACTRWADRLPIVHLPSGDLPPNPSANLNRALAAARGEVLKPMHQDDFFAHPRALELIVDALEEQAGMWGAVGFSHRRASDSEPYAYRVPYYREDIIEKNSLGGPSTMFMRGSVDERLDPELIWVGDVELYYRLRQAFGPPLIVPDTLVCIRHWENQVTNTLAADEDHRRREVAYALRKHRLEPRAQTSPTSGAPLRARIKALLPPTAIALWSASRRLIRTSRLRLDARRAAPSIDLGALSALDRPTIVQVASAHEPPPQVWLRLSEEARVFVVGKQPPRDAGDGRIASVAADLDNPWDLERVLARAGGRIDVVVDPGRLHPRLFELLRPGGAYVAGDESGLAVSWKR